MSNFFQESIVKSNSLRNDIIMLNKETKVENKCSNISSRKFETAEARKTKLDELQMFFLLLKQKSLYILIYT